MSDFYQNVVPTFSRLESENLLKMEETLIKESLDKPMGIIIPALYRDMASPAMKHIIDVLSDTKFIKKIYISLDRAEHDEYLHARKLVEPISKKVVLLYNDAAEVQNIIKFIDENGLPLGPRGKGRAVWSALGYVLAKKEVAAIAFHDADIVTYDHDMLVRLFYPVMHRKYQFTKAYYARFSDKLNGRVVRLFYMPFVRAMKDMLGSVDFLEFMGDFRYPLSGECSMFLSVASELRFPSDWGIEIGILSEIFRISPVNRISQVEITGRYDHKHQELGDDADKGLTKMAVDIANTFFTVLSSRGIIISEDFIRTLKLTYVKNARSYISIFEGLTEMSSFEKFDLHNELCTMEQFAEAIDISFKSFCAQPLGSPMLPMWRRVDTAFDGISDELVKAFDLYS